ncbi:hypothetical protein [Streptomyces formicae]|uniref:Uncharacterized protein n=1 Tax=Streptomyces formicae TaxID=1616117 RepID=A0ABY3WP21_9ACTN|nr:hypothetical protein [Streptomyces formicae]UNM13057.1 hypothetical protein J4032_17495 [Streptomyces formicae]
MAATGLPVALRAGELSPSESQEHRQTEEEAVVLILATAVFLTTASAVQVRANRPTGEL